MRHDRGEVLHGTGLLFAEEKSVVGLAEDRQEALMILLVPLVIRGPQMWWWQRRGALSFTLDGGSNEKRRPSNR
jgi:hypothetical protein